MDTRVQPITDADYRSGFPDVSPKVNDDVKRLTAKWIMAVHPVGIEPPMRRRKLTRLIPNPLNIFAKVLSDRGGRIAWWSGCRRYAGRVARAPREGSTRLI